MRIYCPPEHITQNKITIFEREQICHLRDVMRLKTGARLFVFDGESREYECMIKEIAKERVDLAVRSVKKIPKAKGLNVTLACAIPKKAKIEYIIEKATELGVDTIIPLQTERTIVRISLESAYNKLKRWQNIAKEASKQCGRIKLPQVEPVAGFNNLICRIKAYDLAIIPHLGAGNRHIKDVISNFSRCSGIPLPVSTGSRLRREKAGKGRSILVLIGPEGDFSQDEIRRSEACGCIGVSLGEFTLKVDTAAIAAVSFLRLSNIE